MTAHEKYLKEKDFKYQGMIMSMVQHFNCKHIKTDHVNGKIYFDLSHSSIKDNELKRAAFGFKEMLGLTMLIRRKSSN